MWSYHLANREGLGWPTGKVPLCTPSPWITSPSYTTLLSRGPSVVPTCLWVEDLVPWPSAELFKQASLTPVGTRRHLTLLLLHSLPLTAPAGSLFESAAPCGPAFSSLGCEYMWLINSCQSHLSSVKCHVFGHSYNPRTQWIEGD